MSDFGLSLENHYAQLPEDFYTKMPAEKVGAAPRLIHANPAAAAQLHERRAAQKAAGKRRTQGRRTGEMSVDRIPFNPMRHQPKK